MLSFVVFILLLLKLSQLCKLYPHLCKLLESVLCLKDSCRHLRPLHLGSVYSPLDILSVRVLKQKLPYRRFQLKTEVHGVRVIGIGLESCLNIGLCQYDSIFFELLFFHASRLSLLSLLLP